MQLITDYHKAAIFLAAVDDFEFYLVAAVFGQLEGGLALGEAFLHLLGVVVAAVEAC